MSEPGVTRMDVTREVTRAVLAVSPFHLVEVWSETARGWVSSTGAWIAGRLVLVPRHTVIGQDGRPFSLIRVRRGDHSEVRCSATVVWPGTAGVDAALLSVEPPPGDQSDPWSLTVPLRWGALTEDDAWADAQVTGFSGYTGSRVSMRPLMHVAGWIKARGGAMHDCYHMMVWDEPCRHPPVTNPAADPGRGAPGAVVTCGSLFFGIVVNDSPLVDGRLTIVSAELLATVDEVRQAIEQAIGQPLRLEPIDMRHVPPSLRDDSGYLVTAEDLDYLSISRDTFSNWLVGELPLGFSAITYEAFVDNLARALRADGVDPREVDIRLKGSSTAFFAGRHKTLPATRSEIIQAFRKCRGRFPELFEVREIEGRLNKRWPPALRPRRRPFDAMYTAGIDRVPSDYDLQLSSDAIVAKCEMHARQVGLSPTRETTYHNVYDYVCWDLLRATMPHLAYFMDLMSDALHRDVSIAVFASCGPPDLSQEVASLSSHFKNSDWCITCPGSDDEGGQP